MLEFQVRPLYGNGISIGTLSYHRSRHWPLLRKGISGDRICIPHQNESRRVNATGPNGSDVRISSERRVRSRSAIVLLSGQQTSFQYWYC